MNPFIIGERVFLRPLEDEDAEDAVRWFNDAEVCKGNSHHVYPMRLDDALDYIRNTDDLALAICLRGVLDEYDYPHELRKHIGNIALQNIHPVYRSADLSIVIGEKEYWGKGYGKEACTLLIDHAFNAMNLRRIACATFETNMGMKFLAYSLGFELIGFGRDAAFKNGKYVNVEYFELLERMWKK